MNGHETAERLAMRVMLSRELTLRDVLLSEYVGPCPNDIGYSFVPTEKLHQKVMEVVAGLSVEELGLLVAEKKYVFPKEEAKGRHLCSDPDLGHALKKHKIHDGRTVLEFHACSVVLGAAFRVAMNYMCEV
ncbi:MAG: hypothetical protein WDN27_03985 [Candidatus Saccharibacteria bacterium]